MQLTCIQLYCRSNTPDLIDRLLNSFTNVAIVGNRALSFVVSLLFHIYTALSACPVDGGHKVQSVVLFIEIIYPCEQIQLHIPRINPWER